jgi:hypothetical protein
MLVKTLTRRPHLRGILAGLSAGVLFAAAQAHAATITLNGSNGAVHDSVGDGWAFADGNPAPPNPPPDGNGDLGGQALAIGYSTGVLELRAMSEFALAALSGYGPNDVLSATFTYAIDDVFSTFGPGANFDNTAPDPIAVYAYVGNGAISVSDFSTPAGTQVEVVATGVVTDATIASNGGPIEFDVDVTQELKDFLIAGHASLGIRLATTDSPTSASLDGVLPVITVVLADLPPAPPVFDKDEAKCQKAIAKAGGAFVKTKQAELAKCLDAVVAAVGAGKSLEPVEAKCVKALAVGDPKSKLAKAIASVGGAIAKACAGLTPANVSSPCDAGAADFAAVASCIVADHGASAEALIAAEYRDACSLIHAVNLRTSFPGLCPLP